MPPLDFRGRRLGRPYGLTPDLTVGEGLTFRDAATREPVAIKGMRPRRFSSDVITIGASGQALRSLRFETHSGFAIGTLSLWQSNALAVYRLNVSDESGRRPWNNRAMPVTLMTGNARFPFELPVPVFLPSMRSLQYDLAETAAQAGDVQLTFEGFEVVSDHPDGALLELVASRTFFAYGYQLTIGAGVGTINENDLLMELDAPFQLLAINSDIRTGWRAQFHSTRQSWFATNNRTAIENLAGDGQRPGWVSTPLRLAKNEVWHTQTENLIAGAQTPEVLLLGMKLWDE